MLDLYWGCLIGGLLFGFVALMIGDVIGHAFDGFLNAISFDGLDFLHPMSLVGGITIFGALGLMLTKYSAMEPTAVGLIAGAGALAFSVLLFFIYIKPMKNTESSMGFSVKELVGKVAEVSIPIPPNGCGEVLVKLGAQHTYQIAASFDNVPIDRGVDVVIVEERQGTLYVTALEA